MGITTAESVSWLVDALTKQGKEMGFRNHGFCYVCIRSLGLKPPFYLANKIISHALDH